MASWASITDSNVDRFITLLELAENDGDRSRFKSLLIAEEDRYGQLDLLERKRKVLSRCIADCRTKIERQSILVEEMRARGHGLDHAETLLRNLEKICETLTMVRSMGWPGLDGSGAREDSD